MSDSLYDFYMRTLANRNDPDEMPKKALFHQSPMFAKPNMIFRERQVHSKIIKL